MCSCPLCHSENIVPFHRGRRDFYRCLHCRLVMVPPAQFLSAEEEKRHYDLHENSPADLRYRAFLNRLFQPLNERLSRRSGRFTESCRSTVPMEPERKLPTDPARGRRSQGLDFGSGPGPTLSVMFEEAGHAMRIFDPFYAPDRSVFTHSYDFITASEVVEHLHHPQAELDRLWGCLKPAGCLGIMTKRVRNQEAFASWHYKEDPTHVCFFSIATFEWLAERWQAKLTVIGDDVVLFDKPGGTVHNAAGGADRWST